MSLVRRMLVGLVFVSAVAGCAPAWWTYDPTPPPGACIGHDADGDTIVLLPPDCPRGHHRRDVVVVQICPPVCGKRGPR